jgi:hypothetical protein
MSQAAPKKLLILLGVVLLVIATLPVYPVHSGTNLWTSEPIPDTADKKLAPGTDVSDLAVASDNTTIYTADRQADKLYRSLDAGVTWSEINIPAGATEPQLVAVAPDDAALVAIIADDKEVYVSTDAGVSWSDPGTVREGVESQAIVLRDIAISEIRSGVHYIAVAGSEAGPLANIWYYDQGAVSPRWCETSNLPGFASPVSDVAAALAFSPDFSNDGIMTAVTEEDDAGPAIDFVRFEIFSFCTLEWNSRAGFENYPVILGEGPGVTGVEAASIALAPDYRGSDVGSRVAMVGVSVEGVAEAKLWGIHGLYDYVDAPLWELCAVKNVAYNGTTVVAGIVDHNAVQLGYNLHKIGIIPSSIPVPGENRTVVAWAGENIVAGTSGNSSGFSRATEISGNFSSVGTGYPGDDISDMVVTGKDAAIYAADRSTDKIYKSIDSGSSWTELTGPAGASGLGIIAAASDNADIVAFAADDSEIYLSTDGGNNWHNLGVPTDASLITDIDISSYWGNNIFLAVSGNNGTIGEIWYYEYGGDAAWVEASYLDGFHTFATVGYGTADNCLAVAFSPNFTSDNIIMAVTADRTGVRLEALSLGDPPRWNRCIGYYQNYPAGIHNKYTDITDARAASISISPDYFGAGETLRTIFIGIRADTLSNAGIYRMVDNFDFALETGIEINSVAYNGESLVAGEYDSAAVWRTDAPLTSHDSPSLAADIDDSDYRRLPGGQTDTVVAWAGDSIIAGTTGKGSCFSISTDNGDIFNCLSLVDAEMPALEDVAVATDGSRVYLVSDDGTGTSLWRKYSGAWQRVLYLQDKTGYIIRIAPDNPDAIYLSKVRSREMHFSNNGGATWHDRTSACDVQDMAVESQKIVYVLGSDGSVKKSMNQGSSWSDWSRNGIIPPGGAGDIQRVATSPDDAGFVAVIADDNEVYVSSDAGFSWSSMGPIPDAGVLTDIFFSRVDAVGYIYLAVSGMTTSGTAEVWYFPLGASVGQWKQASAAYSGEQPGTTWALALAFSPNFATDRTLAAVTTNGADTYFELFKLDESPAWNADAGFAGYPVTIQNNNAQVDAAAASIALSAYYFSTDNATREAFIGIRAATPANSGVYRLIDTVDTPLISGVSINNVFFSDASLVAGEYADNDVWRSANPLDASPEFFSSNTSPRGESQVKVTSVGGSLFAGTSGNDSAFSVSGDGGINFTDRSYDSPGTDVSDFAFCSDNTTVYLLDRESGKLKKSTDAGLTWFRELSPGKGYSIACVGPGKVVTGSVDGYVSYSLDSSGVWQDIQPQIEPGALLTHVAATGLDTGDYIFAASSKKDSRVLRWKLGTSTSWEDMAAPIQAGHGIYGLAYQNDTLYVLTSDGTESTLLKGVGPAEGLVVWSNLGSLSEPLVNPPSALRSSAAGSKLWAIGTTGRNLYSFTDVPVAPPDQPDNPAPPAPTGGGGGSSGLTNIISLAGIVTGSGRFLQQVEATSSDGMVRINISKDTIGTNKLGQPLSRLTIREMTNPPALPADTCIVGLPYEFGPAGATFDPPVTLTIKYDPSRLPEGVSENNLRIATWDAATQQWIKLECTVDIESNTITAYISHFSIYTIVAGTRPAEFSLSGLTVSPEKTVPGGDIEVSFRVDNTGDLNGYCPVNLKINGEVVISREVILDGGLADTISLKVSRQEPGIYDVEVNGLKARFYVIAPAPIVPTATASETQTPTITSISPDVTGTAASLEPVDTTTSLSVPDQPAKPAVNDWWFIGGSIAFILLVVAVRQAVLHTRNR